MASFHFTLACGFVAATLSFPGWSQTGHDHLREGFLNPPLSARPRVFWHWMNGNVTQEGVKLDLEWMKRIGLGGAFIVEVDLNTPVIVKDQLAFMTPGWQAVLRTAATTADHLGLDLGISTSPGWSDMGGPWVKPDQSMKKLVWTATTVQGGSRLSKLPQPSGVAGPFQDIPISAMTAQDSSGPQSTSFYRDVAVLAYREPLLPVALQAKVTSSAGQVDADALAGGSFAKAQTFPIDPVTHELWFRFDYPRDEAVRTVSLALPGPRGFGAPPLPTAVLESSADGISFTKLMDLPVVTGPQQTVSFPAVRARHFRVLLHFSSEGGLPPMAPGAVPLPLGVAASTLTVGRLHLSSEQRVNRFEDKAGFSTAADYDVIPTPEIEPAVAVQVSKVVDLTSFLRADGSLDWTAPAGNWKVLRFGYSSTGHQNGPAAADATGLETDKLSARYTRQYLDHYLGFFRQIAGPNLFGRQGIRGILNDSIESGAQNWTDDMLAQFRKRRGYDPAPWLPALTGVIIQSSSDSDKFLWDFRATIAEMIAENHYGQLRASANERNLSVYGEALEDHRPQLGDDLEMRKYTSVPMGAMWTFPKGGSPRETFIADDLGAASVAHLWGQNRAGAESMTAFGQPWAFAPRDLKHIADLEFALGINTFIIHSSVEQPLVDRKPGIALATFLGQYFNRNETWAEQAGPWITYLSRNSYLLQQGHFVADVAYFYGEEAPLTGLYGEMQPPDVPVGFAFDFVNADALRNLITVNQGALVTASGMRYRILYLGGASSRMTVATLTRLRDLVLAGAVVVGNAPLAGRSLVDSEAAFRQLVAELWPASAATPEGASVGKGKVLAGRTPSQALIDLQIQPDAEFRGGGIKLSFVHRRLSNGDLYYLSNPSESAQTVTALFRTAGTKPEIWHADTGLISQTSHSTDGRRTVIPLTLAAEESLFVVFRGGHAAPTVLLPPWPAYAIRDISGPWTLNFESERGGPKREVSTQLGSWALSEDPRIRFFSGKGTYRKTINVSSTELGRLRSMDLDLGDVRDLAVVTLNGHELATLWHAPYRVDVTGQLHAGKNTLEIAVTNLWVNRLIGDEQPGSQKITFTTGPTYQADAPLRPSGLLGPVVLHAVKEDSKGRTKQVTKESF